MTMPNALTSTTPSDNFAVAAANTQSSAIVGERVRFANGRYLKGRGDGEPFDTETPLHAIDIQAAWVKFLNDKVVDQHIGYPMPQREDLDDRDEDCWPLDAKNKPKDPWSNQRYLYLIDPESGAEYTFITSSWSGRKAVDQLVRQIFVKRQSSPGAVAIVKLDSGFAKAKGGDTYPISRFTITGWSGAEASPGLVEAIPAQIRGRNEDLDDEIPF